MRWLWLLVLCLTPTAQGLTVDLAAPEAVPTDPVPFAVDARIRGAEGPFEVKAWLGGEGWQASRTWNGTEFQRSDHYARTVTPDEGDWQGRLWLKANPSSSNAERLGDGELSVGVRVRSADGTADALASVDRLAWNGTAWAAAGPERSLSVHGEEGRPLVRLGSPAQRRPIAVPSPETGLTVCDDAGCQPSLGWRLQRVGEDAVELSRRSPNASASGGVLATDRAICLLPDPPSGSRWRLPLTEVDACRSSPAVPGVARLSHLGHVVDRAPERPGRGEVVRDPSGGWAPWRLPPGVEPAPVQARHVEGRVTVFDTRTEGLAVLADALERARDRVTVTTYLLTSPAAAELLAQTARRGVDVHLFLEPDPVGGQPPETARLVDRLVQAGVEVHEAEGPTPGGLQHAKVVVVDSGLVLVLTENLTEHGLPRQGEGNVGVGIGVANASLASRVEALFREPGEPRELRPGVWEPLQAPVAVVTAPENAWRSGGVPAWIEASEGPVQGVVLRANPRWGPRSNAWLDAMVNHSQQAPVEVTLSGTPEGAARSNREAIAYLEAHPDAGDLDARLSDPREGTLHAKVIATPTGALVGSTNWGLGGVLLNREVNLLVDDEDVAQDVREVLAGPEPGTRLVELSGLRQAGSLTTPWIAVAVAVAGLIAARRRRGPARERRR